MLSVSVVIPIRNGQRTLPLCLAALPRLDPRPAEIVLVDNGSTDGSAELLRAFADGHAAEGVRVVDEPRPGISAARNAGIRAARGEIVAWTDADCSPEPAWLRALTEPFADPTVGGVAGRVLAAPAGTLVELFCGLYTFQTPDRPARHQQWTPWTGGYAGANFAVRRALLLELGGYDERIVYGGDDYDMCARLYTRGAAIVYTPASRVNHHHRATLAGMLRQAFGYGRSHPYLLGRHAPSGLWVELPRWSFVWRGFPARAWLDLASADKKVAALLLLGALVPPLLALLPLYAAWLALGTARRARDAGLRLSAPAVVALAGLLVMKSGAMTLGRWSGSVRYGSLCL